MEIRQVGCFLAVAELRHFGRAADQLNIVQPAVSQQIRRLENELGTPLFHRTTRTVELTPAGAAFIAHAREIMAAVDRASQVAKEAGPAGPALRVGTGSGLGPLLGAALEALAHHQPDLTVELVRLPEPQRLRWLASGKLGAAIVRGGTGPLPRGAERFSVLSETLIAAMPAGLTTPRRRTVRLAELAALPARLPPREQNPALLDTLTAAALEAGVNIERVPAGKDEDMLALIATGPPSWTVFYPHKAELLARQSLRGVAFRRIVAPPVTVTTSIVLSGDQPAARTFLDAFLVVTALPTAKE